MTGASLLPLHEIQGCKAGLRLHVEHQKMHFQGSFTPTLGSYQNELGASEIHALFFQPAR